MKKPFGVNLITFVAVFQIMFFVMQLLFVMFMFGTTMDPSSPAYAFKESVAATLFGLPVEALTSVHYSIIVVGSLIPVIVLTMILRGVKARNLKFVKSMMIVKFILSFLRMSILSVGFEGVILYMLYKDQLTVKYFTEA